MSTSEQDHVLTVFAFLGSATFVALFFLLQSKDFVENYELLVFMISIASILFILAVVGRLNISIGRIKKGTIYAKIVGVLAVFGFFLILLIVVILIAEVNLDLGIIVGVCTLTLYGILEIIARKS